MHKLALVLSNHFISISRIEVAVLVFDAMRSLRGPPVCSIHGWTGRTVCDASLPRDDFPVSTSHLLTSRIGIGRVSVCPWLFAGGESYFERGGCVCVADLMHNFTH
ncbi:hypothetical protein HZ326_10363 [Fusarium oxysporum f. sp. albedinis]|nr:hypothetical protein HZ326_10363 [Fusarium oxysporum f. sp. albedinis]